MFLNIEEFTSDLLQEEHSIRLLQWKDRKKLASFREKLPLAIKNEDERLSIVSISAKDFNSNDFLKELFRIITLDKDSQMNLKNTCLFIVDIEPIVPDAGKILNSFREHLDEFRASIIMIRDDEYYNFTRNCPDLWDWIRGDHIGVVDDFIATSFTIDEVAQSIKAFENHYGLSSPEFIKRSKSYETQSINDAWLWKELLEILETLKSSGENL
jgi:hypothetical protein